MKTKIIKKMLAIMLAATTISTMPGLASAMKKWGGGQKIFLQKKKIGDHSDDGKKPDNDEANCQKKVEDAKENVDRAKRVLETLKMMVAANEIVVESHKFYKADEEIYEMHTEKKGTDDKNKKDKKIYGPHTKVKVLTTKNKKFKKVCIRHYEEKGPDDKNKEDVDYVLSLLNQGLESGGSKKDIAEIALDLVKTKMFWRLYSYELGRYFSKSDLMMNVLDVLKKCQSDKNARPIVLNAIKDLCSTISLYGKKKVEDSINKETAWTKYKDFLQTEWLKANSSIEKLEEKPERTEEEQQKIAELRKQQGTLMEQCDILNNLIVPDNNEVTIKEKEKEKDKIAETFRKNVVTTNNKIISAIFEIFEYCCQDKDSQAQIVEIIDGLADVSCDRISKFKSSEILDILLYIHSQNEDNLSKNILHAVDYLAAKDLLEYNDEVNQKIGDILSKYVDNHNLKKEFLQTFADLSKNNKNCFNIKPELLNNILNLYADNYVNDNGNAIEFIGVIRNLAKNKILDKKFNESVFNAIAVCLSKDQAEARLEAWNTVNALIDCKWFDEPQNSEKAVSLLYNLLSNAEFSGSNDKLDIAKIVSALAKKGLLRFFEDDQNNKSKQNISYIMNACSDDAEASKYIANAIECLFKQDEGKNTRHLVKFAEDNISKFMDILLKCSKNAENSKSVSKFMEYIFNNLTKTKSKDEFAKIMNQLSNSNSINVSVADQTINVLKSCAADQDSRETLEKCFKALFANYFKDNISKERSFKILELLEDLSTIYHTKLFDVFRTLAEKLDYDFQNSKGAVLKIMLNLTNSTDKKVIAETLKKLLIEKGRLNEYFVAQGQPGEQYNLQILEILSACCSNDTSTILLDIFDCILQGNKENKKNETLDGNDELKLKALEFLIKCANWGQMKDTLRDRIAGCMLSLLERYNLNDNASLQELLKLRLKETLAQLAISFSTARRDVAAIIKILRDREVLTPNEAQVLVRKFLLGKYLAKLN